MTDIASRKVYLRHNCQYSSGVMPINLLNVDLKPVTEEKPTESPASMTLTPRAKSRWASSMRTRLRN